MIHHYARLGLRADAAPEDVKASYRRLAKRYHPDMPGGNALAFARVTEAYDALAACTPDEEREPPLGKGGNGRAASHPPRRRSGGTSHTFHTRAAAGAPRDRHGFGGAQEERARPATVTRIMSIAMVRGGTVALDGLFGKIIVEPTTADGLWPTTLAKFGADDSERLARHVVQVRVTGAADAARRIAPRATTFGVRLAPEAIANDGGDTLRRNGKGRTAQRGALTPVVVRCTVPPGTALTFRDTFGFLSVGEVGGTLHASLKGGTRLRAGRLTRATLILQDRTMAFLSAVEGDADLLVGGRAKVLVDGEANQLRAAVEGEGIVEIAGGVETLQTEVAGRAFLHAKGPVGTAYAKVVERGQVRIARLRGHLDEERRGEGRIQVQRRTMYAPVTPVRTATFAQAGL